jgi:hypothetical protein
MKLPVAASWVVPYLVAIGIAVQFSIGFPTSFVPYLVVLTCCVTVGFFGTFFTEVTRYVFERHPFLTSLYGTMISSILLTIITLIIFAAFAIPGFVAFDGARSGWAMLYIIRTLLTVFPATAASSVISIPLAHTLLRRSDRTSRRSQARSRRELIDFPDLNP